MKKFLMHLANFGKSIATWEDPVQDNGSDDPSWGRHIGNNRKKITKAVKKTKRKMAEVSRLKQRSKK